CLPRPLSPHRRGRQPASFQYRSEQARARKRLHQPGYATGVRRLQKPAPADGGYSHRAAGSVLAARRSARCRWTNDHRTVSDATDQGQRHESHGPNEGHHPAQDALVAASAVKAPFRMSTLGEIKSRVDAYIEKFGALRSAIGNVIVGQSEVVEGT